MTRHSPWSTYTLEAHAIRAAAHVNQRQCRDGKPPRARVIAIVPGSRYEWCRRE